MMKKLSLSLLAAGVMAVAGAAHADAIFYPDGTSVDLGLHGADSLVLSSSDTTVLGAGPAVTTVPAVTTQYVYVQPNINFDPALARAQLHDRQHALNSSNTMVMGNVGVSGPYYVMTY